MVTWGASALFIGCNYGWSRHCDGHVLEVIITQSATRVFTRVDPPVFSDHSLISSQIFLGASRALPQEQMTTSKRIWKELEVNDFHRDLQQSSLLTDPPRDVTAFFYAYDRTLRCLVEKHVPNKVVKTRSRLSSP